MHSLKKNILYFLILSLFTINIQASNSKKVLILNSWSPDHNWVKGEIKGIKDTLKQRYENIEFTTEYIDYPRIEGINKEKYIQSYHQFFDNKYKSKKKKFDIIFATDDPALNYLIKYHDLYFPNTPVIFSGINNYEPEKMKDKIGSFLGVLENVDYHGTLDIAYKLHPKAKKFYILGDKTNTSQSQMSEIKKLESNFPIEFVYLDNLSFEDLAKKLQTLTKDDVLFLLAFYSDANGKQLTPQEIMSFLKKNANSPIYGFWKWLLEDGAVLGGKVLSSYDHGREAVEKFYLKDEKKRLLVEAGDNPYIFDYNQLKRFEIDTSLLPKNTQIINKPFSFYETYKLLVNGTVFFITLLIILLGILLINIKKRKKSESNLKKSQKKLKTLNQDLDNKVKERTEELEQSNDELEQTITNLKHTQNQLIESEKMASLGGLVAGVAHEINTPVGIGITGITHFLHVVEDLKEKYNTDNMTQDEFENFLSTSTDLAKQIHSNLDRTAHLVSSFKQVAIDQSNEAKREFNLKEYVNDVLFSLNNIIKKTKLEIKVNVEEDLNINSYPGSYSQIITNLIVNTINHGYDKNEEGTITIDITKNSNDIEFIYKDNGKGINEENLSKVFNPFFTTNREHGGTGLGLNIIYNIVTSNLKGTIECKSKEAQGVEFILVLPFNDSTI